MRLVKVIAQKSVTNFIMAIAGVLGTYAGKVILEKGLKVKPNQEAFENSYCKDEA